MDMKIDRSVKLGPNWHWVGLQKETCLWFAYLGSLLARDFIWADP